MKSVFKVTISPTFKGDANTETVRGGQVVEGALHGRRQVHGVAGEWAAFKDGGTAAFTFGQTYACTFGQTYDSLMVI